MKSLWQKQPNLNKFELISKKVINLDKLIKKWHIFGAIFIMLLGSVMHFLFQWTGSWAPVGAIAAVNESVWEHLKLAYWPLMFYSLIEYWYVKDKANNYLIAKFIAAYSIPLMTVVFFYSYTTLLGIESLAADIISFFIFIIIGQYFSYIIMKREPISKKFSAIALIAIILLGILFVLFTYLPPLIPLFQDGETGLYGIVEHLH